jgi:ribonucleotide monophosphatase NagD (HAD superfamily)
VIYRGKALIPANKAAQTLAKVQSKKIKIIILMI